MEVFPHQLNVHIQELLVVELILNKVVGPLELLHDQNQDRDHEKVAQGRHARDAAGADEQINSIHEIQL